MHALAKARDLESWQGLIKWLEESIQTKPRKLLAAHTTSACQPQKQSGPSGDNLGRCGMDNIQSAVGDDGKTMCFVEVKLPHAYSHGDGLDIHYKSESFDGSSEVENHACLELLCFLVMSGPGRVRLPPNAFKLGQDGINEFREKAMAFARDELVDPFLFQLSRASPRVA